MHRNKPTQFLKRHRLTIIVFLFILFRPQIMSAIRRDILAPLQKIAHPQHCKNTHPKRSDLRHAVITQNAGLIFWTGDDETDDGCGNEDDSCEDTSDNEYYDNTETDGCADDGSCDDSSSDDTSTDETAADDGCSDDGSCDSEDDSYDYEESDSYADDGCSCQGETVVSSDPGSNDYFNSTVTIRIIIDHDTDNWNLQIFDGQGIPVKLLVSRQTLTAGSHDFSWDGYESSGQLLAPGTYYAEVKSTRNVITVRGSFSYSSRHGFEPVSDGSALVTLHVYN